MTVKNRRMVIRITAKQEIILKYFAYTLDKNFSEIIREALDDYIKDRMLSLTMAVFQLKLLQGVLKE